MGLSHLYYYRCRIGDGFLRMAIVAHHQHEKKGEQSMKGSIIIVSFFMIGTLCGYYQLLPQSILDSNLSYYALCGLMFCVGISIGCNPETLKSFRSLNRRLMFLPLMTIFCTLCGCAVLGLLLSGRSFFDCLAVGSVF